MKTDYPGIDYAGSSFVNRNSETGIRYGIIPTGHERLSDWIYDELEPEYSAYCPWCGTELCDVEQNDDGNYDCPACEKEIVDGDQWPESPDCYVLNGAEKGFQDDSGDLWVTESPYYTNAQFCSPCAPGACYLANPCDDGAKAYCLGADWFKGDKAPYPIYLVATDELVYSPE